MTRDDSDSQRLEIVGALTGAFEAALWLIPSMFIVGVVTGMLASRVSGTLNTVLSIIGAALLVGFVTAAYYRVFVSMIEQSGTARPGGEPTLPD